MLPRQGWEAIAVEMDIVAPARSCGTGLRTDSSGGLGALTGRPLDSVLGPSALGPFDLRDRVLARKPAVLR